MRFAPISSLAVAKRLDKDGLLGPYHLLLAHDVIGKEIEYKWFYKQLHKRWGRDLFIIMDNSLVELGRPLPAADLLHAVKIVQANVLVLPDKLSDMIEITFRSYQAYGHIEQLGSLPHYCSYMGVLQGRSIERILLLGQLLRKLHGVKYFSVPRVMTEQFGTRKDVVEAVWKAFRLPIHLLGFSGNIADDMMCGLLPEVIGMDSAVPIHKALFSATPTDLRTHNPRPDDYLDYDCSDSEWRKFMPFVKTNLSYIRACGK